MLFGHHSGHHSGHEDAHTNQKNRPHFASSNFDATEEAKNDALIETVSAVDDTAVTAVSVADTTTDATTVQETTEAAAVVSEEVTETVIASTVEATAETVELSDDAAATDDTKLSDADLYECISDLDYRLCLKEMNLEHTQFTKKILF